MEDSQLRLGEILVEAGVLEEDRLNDALELQKKRGIRLGQVLLQEHFISEPQLVQALSRRLSIPWVSLEHVDIADELLDLVPASLAEEFFLIPVYVQSLDRNNRTLFVAMNDPTDESALRLVSASAGMPVKPMVAGPSDISAAIHTYYYGEEEIPYDTPMIHYSSPPPAPLPSKPSPPLPPVKPVIPGAEKDKTKSDTPEMLTEDQFFGNVEEAVAPSVPPPGSKCVSILDLTESSALIQLPSDDVELQDIAEMVESRHEAEEQQQQLQREVEKHIFGLGMSKHRGMTLTLLDGTTIDFGGAKRKRPGKGNTEIDRLIAALRAVAAGETPQSELPSDKWEQYMAAIIEVLLRKHLIFSEEFLRALYRKEEE